MAATPGFHNMMVISRDPNFQDRVRYALFNAALAVVAEVNTTANHAARVTFAQKIFAETNDIFAACDCVLNNATIAAEGDITAAPGGAFAIPDSDIQFAVNSDFNALAGVAT